MAVVLVSALLQTAAILLRWAPACVDGECGCYEECCHDSDCTGECHTCSGCSCVDDDSKCTGECHNGCSGGSCVNDDTKCNATNCEKCVNGSCESKCDPNTEFCCDGKCCPNHKCCVDGECIRGHCTPMWYTTVLIECSCSDHICSGIRKKEWHWYCTEGYYGDGDCPEGTECVETGEEVCYKYITYPCTGACETSGSECELGAPTEIIKEPRVLCGCCPPE